MGLEGLSWKKTLGVILAGGASRRFGSDKAIADLNGQHMVEYVAARAAPQVGKLVLNAPRAFQGIDVPLVPDHVPGEGPLAGLLAGLAWAREQGFEYIATFPCDTPFFPGDIVERLHGALSGGADCAMARCCDQIHYTFAVMRVTCFPRIEEAFVSGMRSLKALGGILRCAFADFSQDRQGPNCDAFFNINQPADLELAERWLREKQP